MGRARAIAYDIYLVGVNVLMAFPGHRFRVFVTRSVARNDIGRGVALERHVRLTAKGGVTIGPGCNVNQGVVLDGRGGLLIGNRVNISPEAMLLTAEHDPQSPVFEGRERAVSVGDRVWIATRAIVLPGSSLGTGCVVAAGAVVRGEIPPWTIVAGNPAVQVGRRDESAQAELPSYRRAFH